MTTAYSRTELDELDDLFEKRLPPVPVEKDLHQLPVVDALSAAGAPTGLLVRLVMANGDTVPLFFNPVVALRLLDGIRMSADDGAWWKDEIPLPTGQPIDDPTAEESRTANEILSLTTASAGEIMAVHLVRREGSSQMIGLVKHQATQLAVIINRAAEKFGWWDAEFQLLPADGASSRITDKEVWTAAQQVITQYPAEPELEAARRADAAYELGDMFNFALWGRVAQAVKQLLAPKPDNLEGIN